MSTEVNQKKMELIYFNLLFYFFQQMFALQYSIQENNTTHQELSQEEHVEWQPENIKHVACTKQPGFSRLPLQFCQLRNQGKGDLRMETI